MEAIVLLRAHAVQGFRESCLDAARQINCTLRFRPTANETAKKKVSALLPRLLRSLHIQQIHSNNSLLPACLKNEIIDRFRCLQLIAGHHKISWCPELARYI